MLVEIEAGRVGIVHRRICPDWDAILHLTGSVHKLHFSPVWRSLRAINDNYDTIDPDSVNSDLVALRTGSTSFTPVIAAKIRAVQGRPMESVGTADGNVPYGYVKDPENLETLAC